MMVASAAPSTPMCSQRMNTMSSAMLMSEAMARKTTGVLLSPRERSTPLDILYSTVTGMAAKIGWI